MNNQTLKDKLYEIIFESDTPAGKRFDVLLIISILLSVIIVLLDSVQFYNNKYGDILYMMEWIFTILFTIEYFLRIYCIKRPFLYTKSFFGIIDLLSILPTYISIILPASRYLSVIRILRVLRIFRILKLILYIGEANLLLDALISSRRKITVFLFFIFTMVTIIGSIMYLIEGEANGFTSIPRSIYWAIVTITTVGYGDISPQTELGQLFASFAMILGYATIAVPTGIISAEYSTMKQKFNNTVCPDCANEDHEDDAEFCKTCGSML
jgi:voltage-gated potassium channel|tara:strand:+ start:332 stop:1135 length:804 start_codon:yes stop_codon:yes gene_type:complete